MSGPLPSGWTWASPDELTAQQTHRLVIGPFGSDLKTTDYSADGVPLVFVRDVRAEAFGGPSTRYITPRKAAHLSRHLVESGDLLITKMGDPPGDTAIYPTTRPPGIITADCIRLRPDPNVATPEFLRLAFRVAAVRTQIIDLSAGVAQQKLSLERFRHVRVPLAPLNEQGRLTARVTALNSRIRAAKDSLNSVPPLLDKLRQSILAAAFRGDLTADWRAKNPDVEPADKLLARTPPPKGKSTGRDAAISVRAGRAALGVGTQDRDLPAHWRWVDLARVAKLESGHTPSRSHPEYWDGGVSWIGIKDAREHHGRHIASTFQTVSQLGLENSAARLLPAGTVCLSRTASVGYVTVMAHSMATSQDFANWVCTAALLPEYLMFALLAEGEHLLTFGEGSTHTTIYYPALKALQVALPPLGEQHAIVASVKNKLSAVERLEALAGELRDSATRLDPAILAKAFRGELVPQDLTDEPAAVFLDRLRTARSEGNAASRPRSTRIHRGAGASAADEPPAPAPTRGEPQPAFDAESAVARVFLALWPHGPLDKDTAIRRLADDLRADGAVAFQRLRADGPLYDQLADAIDVAVKAGHLDRPKHGQVRACKPDAAAYTADDWRHALLAVLPPSPTDRDDAIRAAAEWARDNCGLEFTRLRADGHIVTGLRSALNSAIRAKLITRIDATRIARAPDSPADRQLSFLNGDS